MKILEKFALALMAPCSKQFAAEADKDNKECNCGQMKIVGRVETAFALTSAESEPPPTSDSKRAHLVAEIMDNDEMKEILERDTFNSELVDVGIPYCGVNCYSIDAENVKRLKELQKSYDELMDCFENLKHEKECLQVRCRKFSEMELELEAMRDQLTSCNALWNEKEHYRKRSDSLDVLQEKYLLLLSEAGTTESQLKAEREINSNKTQLIEDLRGENLTLERKLSDATIAFEREKSTLLCKLKEFECALTCKEQEIKNLAEQFQKHLQLSQDRERDTINTFAIINEVESLKEELTNTKDLLFCCEAEKQHMKEQFQDKLSLINDLRMEIEDWKSKYDNLVSQNEFLEKQFKVEINDLERDNMHLIQEVDDKTKALKNLMEMNSEKSKEISGLLEEIEKKEYENIQMLSELQQLRNEHSVCIDNLESERDHAHKLLENEQRKSKQLEDEQAILQERLEQEKLNAQDFLGTELRKSKQLEETQNILIQHLEEERQNAQDLLERERKRSSLPIDSIGSEISRKYESKKLFESRSLDYDNLRGLLDQLRQENMLLNDKLLSGECCKINFPQELSRLKHEFENANEIISTLQSEKQECEKSHSLIEFEKKELIAELNRWKDKFQNLESESNKKSNELNNLKRILSEIDKDNLGEISDHYEEAESSPWKVHRESYLDNVQNSTKAQQSLSIIDSVGVKGSPKRYSHDSNIETRYQLLNEEQPPTQNLLNQKQTTSADKDQIEGFENTNTFSKLNIKDLVDSETRNNYRIQPLEEKDILSSLVKSTPQIISDLETFFFDKTEAFSVSQNDWRLSEFSAKSQTRKSSLESQQHNHSVSSSKSKNKEGPNYQNQELEYSSDDQTDLKEKEFDINGQEEIKMNTLENSNQNAKLVSENNRKISQTQIRTDTSRTSQSMQPEDKITEERVLFDVNDEKGYQSFDQIDTEVSMITQHPTSDNLLEEKQNRLGNLGKKTLETNETESLCMTEPRTQLNYDSSNTENTESNSSDANSLHVAKSNGSPRTQKRDPEIYSLRTISLYKEHQGDKKDQQPSLVQKEDDGKSRGRLLSYGKSETEESLNKYGLKFDPTQTAMQLGSRVYYKEVSQKLSSTSNKREAQTSLDKKSQGPNQNAFETETELLYWQQKFHELEKEIFNKITNLDEIEAELNYWKQKFHDSDIEKQNKMAELEETMAQLNHWKHKLHEAEKDSHGKFLECENLRDESNVWKDKYNSIKEGKDNLEHTLHDKTIELEVLNETALLAAKESNYLMDRARKTEIEKQREVDDLLQSLNREKGQLLFLSQQVSKLENRLTDLQKILKETATENELLKRQITFKTNDFTESQKRLNKKTNQNSKLMEQLQELNLRQRDSNDNMLSIRKENDEIKRLFDALKIEYDKLLNQLRGYELLAEELETFKNNYNDIKQENEELKIKLRDKECNLNRMERQNKELNDQIVNLSAFNKELEARLIETREEMLKGIESPQRSLFQDLKEEVFALSNENKDSVLKIRSLYDELEQNEKLIADLKEEVVTRDDKISILENYINGLKDEIRLLHKNLEDGVSATEEMQELAFEGYDESLKTIEAHHSKAFHNMKTEIANLEKEKSILQEQLNETKSINDEKLRDQNAYLSTIAALQNDNEMMLTELKILEHATTGVSPLILEKKIDIQSVKESFSRISLNIEANRSQSAALETALFKYQNTSQILLSKTEEAKRIAENEKQKILQEKEEAVKERLNLENQMLDMKTNLLDLKTKYDRQLAENRTIIEDKEKEIQNQNLIMEKMKESTQAYINQLDDELSKLKDLYENALVKINELEDKLNCSLKISSEYQDKIQDVKSKHNDDLIKHRETLKNYSREMSELQEALREIKSIEKDTVSIQTIDTKVHDKSAQTGNTTKINDNKRNSVGTQKTFKQDVSLTVAGMPGRPQEEIVPESASHFNGNLSVQIMNANTQPTLDFVKSAYTKYKQGQLSPELVEQHSIISNIEKEKLDPGDEIVDIYNREAVNIEDLTNDKLAKDHTVGNINQSNENKQSTKPSNEEMFLIYTSSDNVQNNQAPYSIPDSRSSHKLSKGDVELINKTDIEKVFDVTHRQIVDDNYAVNVAETNYDHNLSISNDERIITIAESQENLALRINLTKLGTSDAENIGKSSESSYNGDISQQFIVHSSDTDDDKLKRNETQSKTSVSLDENKPESEDFFDNLSNDQENHYKLARVDAESVIINTKTQKETPETSQKQDLALNFILETAKQETKETFDTNHLRRAKSADTFSQHSNQGAQDAQTVSRQQIVGHSIVLPNIMKNKAEKEVEVNISPTDSNDDKILKLTAALGSSEKDCKKKIEAIKAQYDANIKRMIMEHNEGVKNLQYLHEDMVRDLVKKHESEIKNFRTMTFEAIKKAENFEKENKFLKRKQEFDGTNVFDQEPVKIEGNSKVRDSRLSKTNIEMFHVKPRMRSSGPCTCSLDVNLSDTIWNIFDQVDQEQKKIAEFTYVKYIAQKMLNGNVDALDSQELAFLHQNVCRHWKMKQTVEERLRKKIDALENELLTKQQHAQQHITEMDQKVAEERRRLHELREAVGHQSPPRIPQDMQPDRDSSDFGCVCLTPAKNDAPCSPIRVRKNRPDSHGPDRRPSRNQQQHHPDEMPTRLRKGQDRAARSSKK